VSAVTKATKGKKTMARKAQRRPSAANFAEMIKEATVDAHDESEQAMGWSTMLDEHLELPFDTVVLGVPVSVTRIDHRDDDRLVAICTRGRHKQAIALVDLPLPQPTPRGVEWIEAYRHWLGGR
jgi:hypothetical protein